MSDEFRFIDLSKSSDDILNDHQKRMAKIQEIQQATADAVGEAISEDERIKVSFNETDGVREITLDPRAMRMASEDLANEIARLVNEARREAQQQVQRLVNESTQEGMVDPHDFLQKMPDMERSMGELMQDTQEMTDQLMTIVERMRIAAEGSTPAHRPDSDR